MPTEPTSPELTSPVGAAPGEGDPEDSVSIDELRQTVANQGEAMTEMLALVQSQSDELQRLRAATGVPDEPAEGAEDELPVGAVPEGFVRFYCPDVSEYKVVRTKKRSVQLPNGEYHIIPQEMCEFQNGVCDTNDPDEIEFLRAQVADVRAHVRITEDPEARARAGVVVTDGARGATSHGPSAPARPQAARL